MHIFFTLRLVLSAATKNICDDPDGPGHAPPYLGVRPEILLILCHSIRITYKDHQKSPMRPFTTILAISNLMLLTGALCSAELYSADINLWPDKGSMVTFIVEDTKISDGELVLKDDNRITNEDKSLILKVIKQDVYQYFKCAIYTKNNILSLSIDMFKYIDATGSKGEQIKVKSGSIDRWDMKEGKWELMMTGNYD